MGISAQKVIILHQKSLLSLFNNGAFLYNENETFLIYRFEEVKCLTTNYKNKTFFTLFAIVLIVNIVLFASVFFSFYTILKKDYDEKVMSVSRQASANAEAAISFLEEEIEILLDKYGIYDNLPYKTLVELAHIHLDGTNFNALMISYNDKVVFNTGSWSNDFFIKITDPKNIEKLLGESESKWSLTERQDDTVDNLGRFNYIKKLSYENGVKGYIIASLSASEFNNFLNFYRETDTGKRKYFTPLLTGVSIHGKNVFLTDTSEVDKGEKLYTEAKSSNGVELKNVEIGDGMSFIAIYSKTALNRRVISMLVLLFLLLILVAIFSYKVLCVILGSVTSRINRLNDMMERYPHSEKKGK